MSVVLSSPISFANMDPFFVFLLFNTSEISNIIISLSWREASLKTVLMHKACIYFAECLHEIFCCFFSSSFSNMLTILVTEI